jgi:hypothetical protein
MWIDGVLLFTGYMTCYMDMGMMRALCRVPTCTYLLGSKNEHVCSVACRIPVSKMPVWTHGHEHGGAWTFIELRSKLKMMCLFDMDVSVRDTGEDRRLQLSGGAERFVAGSKG